MHLLQFSSVTQSYPTLCKPTDCSTPGYPLHLQLPEFAQTHVNQIRKDPDAGKDWRQEEKGTTEDEMVGWHHRRDGHEFEQAPGDGDGQGGLACCSPWGCQELDTTERLNNNKMHAKSLQSCLTLGHAAHQTLSMDSPAKNTGVGCHALLQGIFPNKGLNQGLPLCRWILYHLSHQVTPRGIWGDDKCYYLSPTPRSPPLIILKAYSHQVEPMFSFCKH